MNSEIDFYAMTDYLANALDRDSNEEMIDYIKDEFNIGTNLAATIVESYVKKFSTTPIILDKDSIEFLEKIYIKNTTQPQ